MNQKLKVKQGAVSVTTMHRAKGLEFRGVAGFHPRPKVLGCETRWDKAGRMRDTPSPTRPSGLDGERETIPAYSALNAGFTRDSFLLIRTPREARGARESRITGTDPG